MTLTLLLNLPEVTEVSFLISGKQLPGPEVKQLVPKLGENGPPAAEGGNTIFWILGFMSNH
jgi:hypothetical protein